MELLIPDDFSLSKIAESGQCFRVKAFADGTYRFITGSKVLYIRPISECLYEVNCTGAVWRETWAPYFNLQRAYSPICERVPADDLPMRLAADEGRGIRILRQEPWETLVSFIISQRKSIPAIKGAVELLAAHFGNVLETERETIYTFPSPEQLLLAGESELLACKLGYRAPYVKDAVSCVLSGKVDLQAAAALSDVELVNLLKEIRGVGNKVASCVCLFAYGRTGAVPVDIWIQRFISEHYGGQDPFSAYGQDAGILQQYVFFYAQRHKSVEK